MNDDCLFCKIINGSIPSTEVASTETTYAFRDIDPQAPTHVLVVPRRHITNSDSLAPQHTELLGDIFATARKVAETEGLSPRNDGTGYRLVFNNGEDGGEAVPHLHLHVLGGRKLSWPPG